MSQWRDEKTKIKDIFDSIRNFALCGLIFYIGIQSFVNPAAADFVTYLSYFTGCSMVCLSIYLFFINARSFNNIVRREHGSGNVGTMFFYVIPALVFMLGVNLFVQTAFSIQIDNGRKVGELTIQDFQKPEPNTMPPKP